MTNTEVMNLIDTAKMQANYYLTDGTNATPELYQSTERSIDVALNSIPGSDLTFFQKTAYSQELLDLSTQVRTKSLTTVDTTQDPGTEPPINTDAVYPEPQKTIAAADDPAAFGVNLFAQEALTAPVNLFAGDVEAYKAKGLQGAIQNTRAQATAQDNRNLNLSKDWRVKLSLAPGANYLYNAVDPGILAPLSSRDNGTNGVVFPYTPQISVAYNASYDMSDVVHSNYKIFQYKNSGVDNINITCDFTAQDTYEATYLLAVIHFFRSVTKMFYGKDLNPLRGTPPPLCYLTGLGEYQFNGHPLVISNFTYNLPNEVDYIRANVTSNAPAGTSESYLNYENGSINRSARLQNVQPGANPPPVQWSTSTNIGGAAEPTYVPTKMQISIQAHPIVSRNAISNYFSLEQYATGDLLRGNQRLSGGYYGGIW